LSLPRHMERFRSPLFPREGESSRLIRSPPRRGKRGRGTAEDVKEGKGCPSTREVWGKSGSAPRHHSRQSELPPVSSFDAKEGRKKRALRPSFAERKGKGHDEGRPSFDVRRGQKKRACGYVGKEGPAVLSSRNEGQGKGKAGATAWLGHENPIQRRPRGEGGAGKRPDENMSHGKKQTRLARFGRKKRGTGNINSQEGKFDMGV